MKKLLAVLLLCSVLPLAGNAQELAKVSVEPPESTVRIGERFTVSLMIYDVEDMGGFYTELLYVPSVITVESVAPGDFIVSNYAKYQVGGPVINNEIGITKFTVLSPLRVPPGPSGSGELAVITLMAQGEGQSLLALQTAVIWGISENSPPVLPSYTENARVTVELYHIYLPLVSQQSPTT